ncbi:hypothetical protein AKJ37_03105 [candidate division MSBL1 archaeon SCGC-AAA259I09]|uniref:DOD-type homing endonuclease domain-containing protein n=3 Tax=candidate division MSBL1 TaxID=215777 RepID=A0A133USV8_9EURY|nr:hypothetical protein AKJ38_01685 [candidate division MSBL1 archaeon SCGC-AAA259I14]KXA97380.1 hypothetical protein AKJ37_03105 [candidate division MSBL1 archaeon SCGC-AAA259I09]KXA99578.1 hypothetical protein AKJ40_02805 [candidate division MSBL1 archaeon SCGC-AAA259M10]
MEKKDRLDHLDVLESDSVYIIREAYRKYDKPAMLWSAGKDSTTLAHLARKAFFGKVPIPAIYIDTGYHFKEMYDFRDKLVDEWGLNLIVSKSEKAEEEGITPEDKLKCCGERKTQALKKTMAEYGFDALLLGIRRDEHGIRAKERTFCFPPGTEIYGDQLRNIEHVKKGDRVFTHTGRMREVLDISKREYKGDLVKLNPVYGLPIHLTTNHPVLSKKTEGSGKYFSYELEGFDGETRGGEGEITGRASVDWREAESLEKGDWIFVPNFDSNDENKSYISLDSLLQDQEELVKTNGKLHYKSAHRDSLWIENTIELNGDILRTIGYYIAEGSFCRSANQLSFAFHEDEQDLIDDLLFTMKKTFNINGKVRARDSKAKEVLFNSKVLGLFFSRLCGKTAREKKLPYFFNRVELDKLVELVRGCWLGDGSHQRYTTSSSQLAHELRTALLKLDILASIKEKSKEEPGQLVLRVTGPYKEKFKEIFGIESSIDYEDRFDMVKEVKETPRVDSKGPHPRTGGRWIRVKSIETMPYDGKLYNLHVDKHKTYLPHGIAVHNSPRDQDFQWNYKDQPPELWDQYKSKRETGQHLRVHPLLSWTELDVWKYIKRENLPVNPLYFAREGKRMRSLGCKPCTDPVESEVKNVDDMIEEIKKSDTEERSGRAQDKEEAHAMQRLRALGYMLVV